MKTEDGFEAVSVDKLSLSFTCRTCLNTDPDQQMTAIFENPESSEKLTDDLREQLSGLNSKIVRDDGYPHSLCNICVERLVAVNAFRKQCAKAQEYLDCYFVKIPGDDLDIKPDILVDFVEGSENIEKYEGPPKYSENDDPNDGGFESDASSSEYKPDNDECSSEGETLADLKKQTSKNIDKLTCPVCEKTFKTAAIRNNHLNVHKDYNAFPCDECEMAFKCKRYLKQHKGKAHSFGDYTCPICEKKFTITSRYNYHLKTHDTEKKLKCRHCDESFARYDHRKSHELTHGDSNLSFLCNICGRNYKHESSLKMHLKTHDENEKKYHCEFCNKAFSQRGGLKLHLAIHNNVRAHQCDQCGKKFIQRGALKVHMVQHTGERSHHCQICNESFLGIRALRCHCVTVHGQTEKTVKLLTALQDKEDTAETPLVTSEERKTGSRSTKKHPYACTLCSRSYKVPSALATHIQTHNEKREFNCYECGNAFKKASYMEHHIKMVHLKIKPFSCEICNKTFARVGDRNVHMQIHSEEKAHRCSFCGKGFNMAKALQAHVRQHTGEKPFVCIICNEAHSSHKALASHTRRIHANDPQVLRKVEELAQTMFTSPSPAKVEDGASALVTKSEVI